MRIALFASAVISGVLLIVIVFLSAAAGSQSLFVSKTLFAWLVNAMDVTVTAASVLGIIWALHVKVGGWIVPFSLNILLYLGTLAFLLAGGKMPMVALLSFDMYGILLFTVFIARQGGALLGRKETSK